MAIRDIIKYPSKVLKVKAKPVSVVGDEEKALIKDMWDTMYFTKGIGLAAPQIGVSKRIAVINVTGDKKDELVVINPEIVKRSGRCDIEEGCLSVAGVNAHIDRYKNITLKYLDISGQVRKLQASDILAIVIQHELDHLNGMLFIDRINSLKRKLLMWRSKVGVKSSQRRRKI
ncbi:MAG: peptide deformylase [Candidatus Omnitrophica bacterium]|nr:peptide deformylase [Candidatus Omnitrophota bacterium]